MSFSKEISYNALEKVAKNLKHYDSIACEELIDVIGEDEFKEICKYYLNGYNQDYRMFILNNDAYQEKGYGLDFSGDVGIIFEEYEVFFLEQCIDYARETNTESIDDVVELVIKYMQSLIKVSA